MRALATFFTLLSLSGLESARGECMDYAQTMEHCMKDMGGFEAGLRLISDIRKSKQLCQEKKLQQAMGCLENAFNQCVMETSRAKSSSRRDFILTVDAGKWKKGVELLCTNIDYLEEHEGCMNRSLQESGECIYKHQMNFMLEKAEADKAYVNDVHENKRKLVKVACSLSDGLLHCLQKSLTKHCSRQPRLTCLMRDIVFQIMPQQCRRFLHQGQDPCSTVGLGVDNRNNDNSNDDLDEDEGFDEEDEEDDDGNSGYSTATRQPAPRTNFNKVDEQHEQDPSMRVKVKTMDGQDGGRDWSTVEESEEEKELPVQGSYSRDNSSAGMHRTPVVMVFTVTFCALLSSRWLVSF